MLLQLNINNFALIEKLTINFDKGFNVLTGETGAGKSILIDAINYVLGGKFNKDFIRTGEHRTFVEALFSVDNSASKTSSAMQELGIECENLIIISRETFSSGKSISKINGKSLLISSLKAVSSTLLDIHGQHENQNLLDVSNHISYLDFFAGSDIEEQLKAYKELYNKLKELDKEVFRIQGNDGEREKLIDFYKYQIQEIEKANLKVDEDIKLEEQLSVLSNAEKINKVLNNCYENLCHDSEEKIPIFDSLGIIIRDLKSIEKYMDKIKDITGVLEEAYYNIEESIENIRSIKDSVYFDEKEFEYINSRIYQISSYKKKYGSSIKDIIAYKEDIEKKYFEFVNSGEILDKLKHEKSKIIKKLEEKSFILKDIRHKASRKLEILIKNELNYVGLEKSTFKVEINNLDNFGENGIDKVQFLISTNPGEPLKSLEKVVSGGELSRIMLALKTVFINKDKTPSIIFDEVDTGISGRIAQSVAEKMYLISCSHQVFCVTHLPQIACMSDVHYLITKNVKESKTYTNVNKLDDEGKETEIARMIGGSEVTKLTLEHSKELITLADAKKIELKNKNV